MKFARLSSLLAAGALALVVQDASAAFINGAISISAPVKPNNNNLLLATSLDIDEANAYIVPGTKLADFTTATAVSSFVSAIAVNGPFGLPYAVYSLNNGITFTLTSLVEISNTSSELALDGAGIFSRAGFDDTIGDFDITVIKSVSTGGKFISFNFGTTSAVEGPETVPDAGTSVMLLDLGLLGLAALRRKSS